MTKSNPENCKNFSSKCAYHCAQLSYTTQHGAVLIIFPLNFQTSITAQILSIGGEGEQPGEISLVHDYHGMNIASQPAADALSSAQTITPSTLSHYLPDRQTSDGQTLTSKLISNSLTIVIFTMTISLAKLK